MAGLGELDVLGLDFGNSRVYLCEVSTHIRGLQIRDGYEGTFQRIQEKFDRARAYARSNLSQFSEHRFMLWSPVVQPGLAEKLSKLEEVELVVNDE
jgi:hypothetical protein